MYNLGHTGTGGWCRQSMCVCMLPTLFSGDHPKQDAVIEASKGVTDIRRDGGKQRSSANNNNDDSSWVDVSSGYKRPSCLLCSLSCHLPITSLSFTLERILDLVAGSNRGLISGRTYFKLPAALQGANWYVLLQISYYAPRTAREVQSLAHQSACL